jgi:hypothetical protein
MYLSTGDQDRLAQPWGLNGSMWAGPQPGSAPPLRKEHFMSIFSARPALDINGRLLAEARCCSASAARY